MSISDQLSCQELVELVTAYLENGLSPEECARFEAHLTLCRGCRAHLGQMRHTIEIVGTLTEESISPQARDTLLDAFRDWKKR
jgi:anti-sigma factor RsiW